LRPLRSVFRGDGGLSSHERQTIGAAAARAERLAEAGAFESTSVTTAAVGFVADVLSALWLDRRWSREGIDAIVARTAEILELPPASVRLAVYVRTLRERHLVEFPPPLAIETQLGMLIAFAPISEASVWRLTADQRLTCLVYVGEGRPGRRARLAAHEAVNGLVDELDGRRFSYAVPIERWGLRHAALVVKAPPNLARQALTFASETALAFGPLLEIETLLERGAAREASLVASGERRLLRLGADLHDGPVQDVLALAAEFHLFRSQLEELLPENQDRRLLLGRVEDLVARLVALDGDLRELAHSLESPGMQAFSLTDVLTAEIEFFRERSGITASCNLRGDFEALTASQRIALLRLVQEALKNVQAHSGATEVKVTVEATRANLRAEVVDNGRGFDVDRTIVELARSGHLGLVGMGERIRLLGGRFDVRSQPGGPTVVSAVMPRWKPD
jgi:signal transduction histidine kinase